jgi:hypothetical protein
MRSIVSARSAAAQRAPAGAARWVLLLVAALACCEGFTDHATAQTPKLQPASNGVGRKVAHTVEWEPDEIRIASGEKSAVKQSAKTAETTAPAVQPPAQTPAAPPASVRQSPKPRFVQSRGTNSAKVEALPAPKAETLPLIGTEPDPDLNLTRNGNGLITLIVRDKSLSQVLALIAQTQNLNIVASNDIDALISITLRDVPMEEALSAILSVANYTWVKRNNIIMITSLTEAANLPPDVQGRQIQVFDLDFASATVVAETVKNFLSPIGKVSVGESNPTDNRLTQERVVVEDLPESICRIGEYIAQVDRAPRQVLIEAHVLQIDLDDTTKCGVNLGKLMHIAGSDFNVQTTGFANENAPQAFLATLSGGSLTGVIELIQTTTDAKTLGSPKLLVLNEQEARLQVGDHTPYATSTTTETSTVQSVQFLDTGTILSIIPRITRDGRVLLHVRPEISEPKVTPNSDLPGSKSTELQTSVLLKDGEGMIIGGLINEADDVKQEKVPYLGNVKGVGFLFRRSEVTKKRKEIIIALLPRIQPYNCEYHDFEQGELVKASVPLTYGPLKRTDRPWDPVLPDGKRVSYPLIPKHYRPRNHYTDLGPQYVIPPTPLPKQNLCDDPFAPTGPYPADVVPEGHVFQDDLPQPAVDELRGTEVISDQP